MLKCTQATRLNSIYWRPLLRWVHRSLAVSVSVMFLTQSITATQGHANVKRSQLKEATSQDGNRTAASQAFAEAMQLLEQGTAQSKRQAIKKFEEALLLWRAVGNRAKEASTLREIAEVYFTLGEEQKTLSYYNQALTLSRAMGDKANEAFTLRAMAGVYASLSKYQQALAYDKQALSLFHALDMKALEAFTLNEIGRIYLLSGEAQQALSYDHQAQILWHVLDRKERLAFTLNKIGQAYFSLGDVHKALLSYNQALSLYRALADHPGEGRVLYRIADLERSRGNFKQALTQIEAAIKIVEQERTKERAEEASLERRTKFLSYHHGYYELYIDLLMQLHKQQPLKGYEAQALKASEGTRARTLLEMLTEAKADIRQGVEPKLLERERALQQQLDVMEKRRIQLLSGSDTAQQAEALETDIFNLLTQYREVQAQIRFTSPHYAALTQPQPLGLAEIQQRVLDDNTLLLEYSLGEERSYLWAVSKTGINSYELPKRAVIEAAAKHFRDALIKPTQRNLPTRVAEASIALSQIILEPVATQLGHNRLLIVSDGVLQYVPFAALTSPRPQPHLNHSQPLMMTNEIINLPSASTLAVQRHELVGRQPATKMIAVLADPVFNFDDERLKITVGANFPSHGEQTERSTTRSQLDTLALERAARNADISVERLPFSRQEGERILALVPAAERMQAFDFAANREAVTNPQLSQYRIVHFATHGILDSKHPELSGLVLSLVNEKGEPQNGFLRLHDIFNLKLSAELVVLSACQTGLGEEIWGEGLVGLTRGFMYAGAKRLLVSLWSVDDEATSELMSRFYKKMLQDGLHPTAALRATQIEMLQDTHWKSPYYWAAFTLQGEWR